MLKAVTRFIKLSILSSYLLYLYMCLCVLTAMSQNCILVSHIGWSLLKLVSRSFLLVA